MRSRILGIRIKLTIFHQESVGKYQDEWLEVEDHRNIEGPVESISDPACFVAPGSAAPCDVLPALLNLQLGILFKELVFELVIHKGVNVDVRDLDKD